MLTCLILVVRENFDLLAFRQAKETWIPVQSGLGGYVLGRSFVGIYKKAPDLNHRAF
jgi:hypothetical protein